ncbi:hypothetical protein CMK22_17550 [Candidatus Poribacteria bacterium]|nr:hypothetical protein [Candidatus Poribacteria bacterium]
MNTSKSNTAHVVSWTVYPTVIIFGLALNFFLLNSGFPLQISAYIPIILGVVIITFLEHKFPYRKSWLPKTSDVRNDAAFMVVVQVILPRILSLFVAFTISKYIKSKGLTPAEYWPHHFLPIVQAFLMVLFADFFRYWFHRASHEWYSLWRLHAVHHSPHKLYWINVGRFHPIDKTLQFLFDSLPFIIVGVSGEVLAIYFVFYAINGFFQHCNIDLKLGFLNYIISGPELHRWHHSFIIEEANKNYGNNLIIWDLLFGTWFLPTDRAIKELGLKNRQYPLDFANQMRTPFIKDIDQDQV